MTGFGEALRFERERRGISLHALSAETKVQPRHFLALEQDAFGELPGGVFRRGILRAYLHALEVEEQEWVPRFDQCLVEYSLAGSMHEGSNRDTWMEFAENVQRNRSGNRRKRDWRWSGIAIMLAVIALSCWALWHFDLHALVGR